MPPKGRVTNVFAALDSDEDGEEAVTFHQTPAPVRTQKPQKLQPKGEENAKSKLSAAEQAHQLVKKKKLSAADQVQKLVCEVVATNMSVIILEYLNIPRAACAFPIVFASSGDYSPKFGASWTAEITLLEEGVCAYLYKSVMVSTKKYQRTLSVEIARKGTFDVLPGSFFLFNWRSETKTEGEYGGHQDIFETECDLTWQVDILVSPIVRASKIITGLPPPSNSVFTPPSKAPTNIWKVPEVPIQTKVRLSKQGQKRRDRMTAAMIVHEQILKDEKAARIRQQEQEKKDVAPLHVSIDFKFAMSCPLFDAEEPSKKPLEMIWRTSPQKPATGNPLPHRPFCACIACSTNLRDDTDWMKTNPIAWKLFVQTLQDVLRCFS